MGVKQDLIEKRKELEGKQDRLGQIFGQAGEGLDLDKVTAITGTSAEKAAAIKQLNDELTALGAEVDRLEETVKAQKDHDDAKVRFGSRDDQDSGGDKGKSRDEKERKTIGELFAESDAFKQFRSHAESTLDIGVKTLFQTSAGWSPEAVRSGRVVLDEQEEPGVLDFIPSVPTSQNAYVYMEETTFTNNAAGVAEGGAFPEAAFALTERSSSVRKIATFIPVTDEQLEDEAAASAYLNARLPFQLRQKVDQQILTGGGGSDLTGLLNVVGIQTQAKGADPTPDAVYKAMVKIRVTGKAAATASVWHPNDWQDIRLLRTADGIYIWGNPADAGPERIWGLRVVQSTFETENTVLLADFARYVLVVERRGITMKVSDSHDDYFVKGKQAIRADVRLALVALRPTAIATVTGV